MPDYQLTLFPDNPEYAAFEDKFVPKKTTDDCYTPERVYDAVAEWVCGEYGVERGQFVRPFYPGGDYETETYPPGCVVVDNPPFSIITKIARFYLKNGVRFFLFAPTLTLFSVARAGDGITCIPCAATVTYDNGAKVNTSFVTSLSPEIAVRSAPALYAAVDAANRENAAKTVLPKYTFPAHVITATRVARLSHYGIPFAVRREDCTRIDSLDVMWGEGKSKGGRTIFGSGFLLSERMAAERMAAERMAAERMAAERMAAERMAKERGDGENDSYVWELSEREWAIVKNLGRSDNPNE